MDELVRAWMPNFALDSVVVTVDGWDHHFGPAVLLLPAFFILWFFVRVIALVKSVPATDPAK
ncbi:hypothetical protein ACJJI4_17460 [Microbulbifer sp. TRSA002]|uniref:hypothetical protein n=1 Tax=Microbulbifer sp. TRSA002 TaxID=3243382 RepID=UPI004039FF1F